MNKIVVSVYYNLFLYETHCWFKSYEHFQTFVIFLGVCLGALAGGKKNDLKTADTFGFGYSGFGGSGYPNSFGGGGYPYGGGGWPNYGWGYRTGGM